LINGIENNSKSFLIITGTDLGFLRNKELTNEMIDNYLNSNYNVSGDTIFEGKIPVDFMRVRRIERKP
jgi:hypothetical protein